VVLEVTAKTDKDISILIGRKEYLEVGYDLDGNQRMGSWEIKEILDLSLQPARETEERFMAEMPEGTKRADVEVGVTMFPSPKEEIIVHRVIKRIHFGVEE
jgi:hypothetical protein